MLPLCAGCTRQWIGRLSTVPSYGDLRTSTCAFTEREYDAIRAAQSVITNELDVCHSVAAARPRLYYRAANARERHTRIILWRGSKGYDRGGSYIRKIWRGGGGASTGAGGGSGSDKREAWTILNAMMPLARAHTTDAFYFTRDYNKWPHEVQTGFRQITLTTLDKNPTGSQTTAQV